MAEKPPERTRDYLDLSPEAERRARALTTKVIKAHFDAEDAAKEQAAYAEDQAQLGTLGYGKPGQQRLDEVGAYARVDPDVARKRDLIYRGLSTAAGIPNVDERTARHLVNPMSAVADAAIPIPLGKFMADEGSGVAIGAMSRANSPTRRAARKALGEGAEGAAEGAAKAEAKMLPAAAEEAAEAEVRSSRAALDAFDAEAPTGFHNLGADPDGNLTRIELDIPMRPLELEQHLRRMDTAQDVAAFISDLAADAPSRAIAKKIAPYLGEVRFRVQTSEYDSSLGLRAAGKYTTAPSKLTSVGYQPGGPDLIVPLKLPDEVVVRSRYTSSGAGGQATSKLSAPHGTDVETLLHEVLHAATSRRFRDARLASNRGTALAKAGEELTDLFKRVQRDVMEAADAINAYNRLEGGAHWDVPAAERERLFARWKSLNFITGTNALENPEELISWGLTNSEFQAYLKTIKIDGRSGWTVFVERVAAMLGITDPKEHNALTALLQSTEKLLDAPLKEVKFRRWTKDLPDVGKGKPGLPEGTQSAGPLGRWLRADDASDTWEGEY